MALVHYHQPWFPQSRLDLPFSIQQGSVVTLVHSHNQRLPHSRLELTFLKMLVVTLVHSHQPWFPHPRLELLSEVSSDLG